MREQHLHETVDRLYHSERWGTSPTILDESVAEHTFEVTYISYLLALDLKSRGQDVSIGEVIERALLHDFGEAITGDIPRHTKHGDDSFEENLEEIERRGISDRLDELDERYSPRIEDKIHGAKDESLEGRLVACGDIISAVRGAKREIELGNEKIIENANLEDGIESAREIVRGIIPAEELLNDVLADMGFEQMVTSEVELSHDERVFYFSAEWCGPCEQMGPIWDEWSETQQIETIKVDVDQDPEELSEKFNVRSLPTLIHVREKSVVNRDRGIVSEEELDGWVQDE